jgi:predicted RNA-binding Zn-ribbon protein involved in translation (DUF1610 family)
MTIRVACKCGKRFAAQPHLAGKRFKCPSCGLSMTVPAQQTSPVIATTSEPETLEETQARNSAQSVNCKCGARLRVKRVHAGQTGKCPKCGNLVVTPATKEDSASDQRLANRFASSRSLIGKPLLKRALTGRSFGERAALFLTFSVVLFGFGMMIFAITRMQNSGLPRNPGE